jgi:hypothetical protein
VTQIARLQIPRDAEGLHEALALRLQDLTQFSESEVLAVGDRVAHMVELAESHAASLASLQENLRLDELAQLSTSHKDRLLGLLERVNVCLVEQMEQVEALSEIASHVLATHLALRRGIQSARLLGVHVRVEGAVLDVDGLEVSDLADKLETLGKRMESASADVVTLLSVLQEALPALLRRLRDGLVHTEELRRAMVRHGRAISQASHSLSKTLTERFGRCLTQVEKAVKACHRALSALQFQDPVMQTLQRLDPLAAEARVAEGDSHATPYFYGAGFAADAACALDSEDDELAMVGGQSLFF